MKLTITFLFLISALNVFAGPEDRRDLICFKAKDSVLASAEVIYCFGEINLDLNRNLILTNGYASNTPAELLVTQLIRQTEDEYSFVSKKVIKNIWETGCGEGEFTEIEISGRANFNGEVKTDSINLKVNQALTVDTCHSYPQHRSVIYQRYHY